MFKKVLFIFLCFFVFIEIYALETIDDFKKAFQEVSYSYYMRGTSIQYSKKKSNLFSPEEATNQDNRYTICSTYSSNIYSDLFDNNDKVINSIFVKDKTSYSYLVHAKNNISNINNNEVIAYGFKDSNNMINMKIKKDGTSVDIPSDKFSFDTFLENIEIGDILTYTGHVLVVYDLIKDSTGKVVDAYLLHSTLSSSYSDYNNNNNYAYTKISGREFNNKLGFDEYFLWYTSFYNKEYNSNINEGTINLVKISTLKKFSSINKNECKSYCSKEYAILRPVQIDKNGNVNFYSDGKVVPFTLTKKTKDRLKYSKLYIEKTVDVSEGSVVDKNEELTYKIIIKNNSDSDYTQEINVYENISNNVEVVEKNNGQLKNNILTFNIGKLKSKEEKEVEYKVKVKEKPNSNIIESTGRVENIKNATVINTIGTNLTKEEKTKLEEKYNELKDEYVGKELINEVYKNALNIDLNLNEFEIEDLIIDKDKSKKLININLNKLNNYEKLILNNYWSTLNEISHNINGIQLKSHDNKFFSYSILNNYNRTEGKIDEELNRNFNINKENFKTGDILVYKNSKDERYEENPDKTIKSTQVTNEDGEYAYMYIEGQGFVGINIGNDNIKGTKDDRNDFNYNYYKENNLTLDGRNRETDENMLTYFNYQTLFAKDYYVILRPSLMIKRELPADENKPVNPQTGQDYIEVIIVGILLISTIILYILNKKRKINI